MSKRLEKMAERVAQLRNELRKAKIDYRAREILECDPHNWEDRSYENSHNGDWETLFVCVDCGHWVCKDPRAKT